MRFTNAGIDKFFMDQETGYLTGREKVRLTRFTFLSKQEVGVASFQVVRLILSIGEGVPPAIVDGEVDPESSDFYVIAEDDASISLLLGAEALATLLTSDLVYDRAFFMRRLSARLEYIERRLLQRMVRRATVVIDPMAFVEFDDRHEWEDY